MVDDQPGEEPGPAWEFESRLFHKTRSNKYGNEHRLPCRDPRGAPQSDLEAVPPRNPGVD